MPLGPGTSELRPHYYLSLCQRVTLRCTLVVGTQVWTQTVKQTRPGAVGVLLVAGDVVHAVALQLSGVGVTTCHTWSCSSRPPQLHTPPPRSLRAVPMSSSNSPASTGCGRSASQSCWQWCTHCESSRPGQVFKLSRGGLPDIISLMQIYLPSLIQQRPTSV